MRLVTGTVAGLCRAPGGVSHLREEVHLVDREETAKKLEFYFQKPHWEVLEGGVTKSSFLSKRGFWFRKLMEEGTGKEKTWVSKTSQEKNSWCYFCLGTVSSFFTLIFFKLRHHFLREGWKLGRCKCPSVTLLKLWASLFLVVRASACFHQLLFCVSHRLTLLPRPDM